MSSFNFSWKASVSRFPVCTVILLILSTFRRICLRKEVTATS